jgi:hypothetical protein
MRAQPFQRQYPDSPHIHSRYRSGSREGDVPMKRPRKNKVIVRRELEQSRLKFALVDEAAGLVDYD